MFRNLVVATLVLLPLLAGCEQHNTPAPLRPEAAPFIKEGRIQFDDSGTKDKIKVVRAADPERMAGGLVKVVVTLRNVTDRNLWCPIRTTFLDAQSHVLGSDQTPWEEFLVEAGTVAEYKVNSMSSEAADYQIIIRKPAHSTLRKR